MKAIQFKVKWAMSGHWGSSESVKYNQKVPYKKVPYPKVLYQKEFRKSLQSSYN